MTDSDLEQKYDWERGVKWIWSRPISWRKVIAAVLFIVHMAATLLAAACSSGMKRLYTQETGNWWL
jgi:hypothetical protein